MMNDTEAIEMMRRCKSEIELLRSNINLLQPKADAYDNISALLGMLPKPRRGHTENMEFMLGRKLKEMEKKSIPIVDDASGLQDA